LTLFIKEFEMDVLAIRENLDMDEHTQNKLDVLTETVNKLVTKVEVMSANIASLDKVICEIKATFVTAIEFKPIKTVVYTIVSIAGIAVIGAVLKWVVIK